MTTKSGLFAAAWAISCGAAFLIGRSSITSPEADSLADTGPSNRDSNSSSGRVRRNNNVGSSQANSSPRRNASASGASSEEQLDLVRTRVKELKKLSDPIARAEGFLNLVKNLSPDEYLAAIDAFRDGGINNEQFGEYRMLLTSWAQVDPIEALAYATENTGTSFARQTILAAWAKNDTEGAVAWARDNFDNNGDENRANPWIIGVIEGISSVDLGRATQLLEELPFSRGRGKALDAVFAEVRSGGADSAKSWVTRLTDERLKQGAAARLAGLLAEDDPQGAADWAASMGPDIMKRAAGDIVGQWADQDLDSAVSWVQNQPEDVVASAGPSLVREMIQNGDPIAASTWLSNYEGNPAFDESVRTLAFSAIEEEPTLAADWIMRLSAERDQERTFHRVLGRWMASDLAGVMDYVTNNPVPESIKRRAQMTNNQQ